MRSLEPSSQVTLVLDCCSQCWPISLSMTPAGNQEGQTPAPSTPGLTHSSSLSVCASAGRIVLSFSSVLPAHPRQGQPAWCQSAKMKLTYRLGTRASLLFQRLRSDRARSKAQNQGASGSGSGDKEGALMYWDPTALLVGVFFPSKQERLGMGSREESPFSFHTLFIRSSTSSCVQPVEDEPTVQGSRDRGAPPRKTS